MENISAKRKFDIKNFAVESRPLSWDMWLVLLSVLYVTLPIVLFFFGWLRIPFAILFSLPIIWLALMVYRQLAGCDVSRPDVIRLITKDSAGYWIMIVAICAVWVYFSGIGSMVYQNSDFAGRNPAYRDLHNYSWPVIYDLSEQSELVQSIAGSDMAAFSYYFTFWLAPAFVSKLLPIGDTACNLILYGWTLLGILLIVYSLHRIIGKRSYIVIALLIGFSGLDIIPYALTHADWSITDHIEWWARSYFQYSSNTTQLFWVFNQSVPCWLITAMVLKLRDNKYVGGLSALVFAYSPWATFGILFIAIAGSFGKGKKIKNVFNICNITSAAAVAFAYALFYLAATGSSSGDGAGLIFFAHPEEKKTVLFCLVLFIFLEAGIYFLILGKNAVRNKYYAVVLAELMLFPFVYVIDWNFVMRGSIPALFILMVYVMDFLVNKSNDEDMRIRKCVMIVTLAIGMITPLCEISRTVNNTITMDTEDLAYEEVYSFGQIASHSEYRIEQMARQHYVHDYKNKPFFKYIGKQE